MPVWLWQSQCWKGDMRQCDGQTKRFWAMRIPLQAGSHPAAGGGKDSPLRKAHERAPVAFLLPVHTHKCMWTKAPDSKGTWKKHPQDTVLQSLVLGTRQELPTLCSLGLKRGRAPHLSTGPRFPAQPQGQKETLIPLHSGYRSKHQQSDKDQSLFTFPIIISAAQHVLTHGSRGLSSTVNTFPVSPPEPSVWCTRCFLHFPLNTQLRCTSAPSCCALPRMMPRTRHCRTLQGKALYQMHV